MIWLHVLFGTHVVDWVRKHYYNWKLGQQIKRGLYPPDGGTYS